MDVDTELDDEVPNVNAEDEPQLNSFVDESELLILNDVVDVNSYDCDIEHVDDINRFELLQVNPAIDESSSMIDAAELS